MCEQEVLSESYINRVDIQKISTKGLIVTIFSLLLATFFILPSKVSALSSQVNAPQVTLNPGGGALANGSDGLRFTINSAATSGSYNNAIAGQDGVVYKGTYQYCCSAGAPMLNIGGTLYGQ